MAAPPTSLDALFANKTKKKTKATNLNPYSAATEAAAPKPKPFLPAEGNADQEGWERAVHKDQELLKACNLWIKDMDADGACLFRAFSDQLAGDGGASHLEYRDRCVDFLEKHRDDFEPFIEEEFGPYCRRMRQTSTWGGHVEAQALARTLGVNCVIYQPAEASKSERLLETTVDLLNSDASEARCVQLSYHPTHHHGQHYNSVRVADDDGKDIPPALSHTELKKRIEEALRPKPKPEPVEKEKTGAAKARARGAFARMTAQPAPA